MSPKKSKKKKPKKAKKGVKKARTTAKAARKKAAARAKPKPKKKKTAAKPKRRPAAKRRAKPKARKKVAAKGRPRSKKAPARTKAAAAKRALRGRAASPKDKAAASATIASTGPAPTPATRAKPPRRRARRTTLVRRGPDGEILAPGDLLLPGGARSTEELSYLFRGCMAAERPASEEAVNEVLAKRGAPEGPGDREELLRAVEWARGRFEEGDVEPLIPARTNLRRTFQGVVDRARQRRREIGAFLRGLDMGHTETSHMDAHGEASLQSLMEWAARLENLVENLSEAEESSPGHYNQFHRVLDQLESTTEALIIDVEQTLRRLRDRLRA